MNELVIDNSVEKIRAALPHHHEWASEAERVDHHSGIRRSVVGVDADLAATVERVIAAEGISPLRVIIERRITTVAVAGAHRPILLFETYLMSVHHRLNDRRPGIVLALSVR